MSATEAREWLKMAVATATGREILRDMGLGAIIKAPEKGDDASTIAVVQRAKEEMSRRYGL